MTVEVPEYGGCLWPVDPACLTDQWESYSPEVRNRALALASSTLRRLTGNRVGHCPITVRPCGTVSRACSMINSMAGYSLLWTPMNWAGTWTNCGCGDECTVLHQVELPTPVGRVDQVKVDGVVVPPTDYRVDNGRYLVNLSDTPWPSNQDLASSDSELGTFSVTYLNAYPVDSTGAYAVGVLALEFAKACSGNKCRLPVGVTNISRQGVTMEIATGAFPGGMTGIREVDTYIALWNPDGLRRQATVWSPDQNRPRHTTFGAGQ